MGKLDIKVYFIKWYHMNSKKTTINLPLRTKNVGGEYTFSPLQKGESLL